MNAHDAGKAEAAKAVRENWLRLAAAARQSGMTELAEQAETFAALKQAEIEKAEASK